jgi:predicted secreted protein
MSLTLTLIILFVIELLAVSAIASLLLVRRNHKQAALLEIYRNRAADYEKKLENELLELDNIGEKLTNLLEPVKKTHYRHRKKEIELLEKRIQFIQAEVNAIISKEDGDEYWDKLCVRLGELMPSPVMDVNDEQAPGEETDTVPQIVDSIDDDIPTLSQKIRIDKNSPTIAYITLTPLQNEIKRLKRIVGRHFGMLSDMKQAIVENKNDVDNFTKLPRALKELQIVHVQLTRSVKALKEENARLTKILTTENSIAGDSDDLMDDSKRKALASLKQNQAPQRPPRKRSAEG